MSTPASALASAAPVGRPEQRTGAQRLRRGTRTLLGSALTRIGLVTLLLLFGFALVPQGLLPHDPFSGDISLRHVPPFWMEGANRAYVLGTDALGRDLLSRVIFAARFSLSIAVASTLVALVLGTVAGLVSGYFGGLGDAVIMRLAEIQMAFPVILLTLSVVAVLGPSVVNLILVMGLSGWAQTARVVRGSTLSVRGRDYVDAARSLGAEPGRILRHHVLPNVVSPLIVMATFEVARLLLLESALSFLGLGIQPPTPSWGNMIADGRNYLFEAWWVSGLPGLAIIAAVLGFNYVGDGLRDALDPELRLSRVGKEV